MVGGTYAPGAQLKEEHLARELEISRTPIRAALKRLVDDGLATADPNRGVRVAEWTEFDIEETFELRGLLEAHAAELAARRGGVALADRLDELNEQMDRAIAEGGSALPERLQVINARFHRAILEAQRLAAPADDAGGHHRHADRDALALHQHAAGQGAEPAAPPRPRRGGAGRRRRTRAAGDAAASARRVASLQAAAQAFGAARAATETGS